MASDTISEYLLTKTVIKQKRKRNNFYGFIKDFKVPMYLEVCVLFQEITYVSVCTESLQNISISSHKSACLQLTWEDFSGLCCISMYPNV